MAAGYQLKNQLEGLNPHQEDLDLLWKQYREEGSSQAREKLIIAHLSLVRFVIGRLLISLPSHLEAEDLFSYGILGLISAIEGFDHQLGYKFSTYAVPRIRGAILDELRVLEGIPSSWRKKSREISQVMSSLEARLNRPPEDEEVAAEMGLEVGELRALMDRIRHPSLLSLQQLLCNEGEEFELQELLADQSAEDPAVSAGEREVIELLGELIEGLPEKEALVISLYYREGLTLKEIAETLELSSARISQLHSKAIYRLRGLFGQKIRSGFSIS